MMPIYQADDNSLLQMKKENFIDTLTPTVIKTFTKHIHTRKNTYSGEIKDTSIYGIKFSLTLINPIKCL